MGIIKDFSSFRKAFKTFRENKHPNLIKTGENLQEEENKARAKEMKELEFRKKRILKELEVEREKIKSQIEIDKAKLELQQMREELLDYEEDEEDDTNDSQNPETMLMSILMNAFNKNNNSQNANNQQNINFPQEQTNLNDRAYKDEELLQFLRFLSPEHQQAIKNIPDNDLLRAKQLLNQ